MTLNWRHNERDGVSNHHPDVVYSTVYSGADKRKHQSSASLALVRGIHRWPVNYPHKGPVTRKMFPIDDVIMTCCCLLPHGITTEWNALLITGPMWYRWSPVEYSHKWFIIRWFGVFLIIRPHKLLNKQYSYRWFSTPSRSCEDTVMECSKMHLNVNFEKNVSDI